MNTNKGNVAPMRNTVTVCVCAIGIILVISSIMFVRTYMSHANRWTARAGIDNDSNYNTYGILSQNMTTDTKTQESVVNQVNSITNMVDTHSPDIVCLQNTSENVFNNLATYLDANKFDVIIKYADETNQSATPICYSKDRYSLVNSGYFWLSDTPNISSNAWLDEKAYIVTWAILKENETSQTFGVVNVELSKDVVVQSKSLECLTQKCDSIFADVEYTICGTLNCTSKDDSFTLIDTKYSNLSVVSNKLFNVGPTTTNGTDDKADDYVYDYFYGTSAVKSDRYAVLKDAVGSGNGLMHYGLMANIYFESEES